MVSSRGPIKCLLPALSVVRLKCEDMNETTLLLCYLEPSGYQYMAPNEKIAQNSELCRIWGRFYMEETQEECTKIWVWSICLEGFFRP